MTYRDINAHTVMPLQMQHSWQKLEPEPQNSATYLLYTSANATQ